MSAPVPTVTVSMPARNAGRFIADAVASVLRQEGVDLELIVVDDASSDDTSAIVQGMGDPRLRLVRNARRAGVAACHNMVVRQSTAPFVAHVDADDVILPSALATLVRALERSPEAGQCYCHYLRIDASGKWFAHSPARQRELLLAQRPSGLDYRRALICHGMVVNTLRTYRRTALDVVGPFDERLDYAVDYDMAVRIADQFDIVLAPEFLYLVRIHDSNLTESLRFKPLRFWWKRATICHRLLRRSASGTLLGRTPLRVYGLLLLGLLHAVEVPRTAKQIVRAPGRLWRRIGARSG